MREKINGWLCKLGAHGWSYTYVSFVFGWAATTRVCRHCRRVEHFETDPGAMGDQGDWVEGL